MLKPGDRVEVINDRGDRTQRTLIGRKGVISSGPYDAYPTQELDGPRVSVKLDEWVTPFGYYWDFPVSFLKQVQ